jgi:hypothetical protein
MAGTKVAAVRRFKYERPAGSGPPEAMCTDPERPVRPSLATRLSCVVKQMQRPLLCVRVQSPLFTPRRALF